MIGQTPKNTSSSAASGVVEDTDVAPAAEVPPAAESGGREGLDPIRYGDWEKNGRCIDF